MGESAIRPTPDTFEPIGEFEWKTAIRSSCLNMTPVCQFSFSPAEKSPANH